MKTILEYKNWADLNERLSELTKSGKQKQAGDIFENLCKYYLLTAPHYRSKLKDVWLLKEISAEIKKTINLPDSDEGIDLIAETKKGEFWAIQAKYRSDFDSTLTVKGDLSTFANLAFNHCNNIIHGLVLTTSSKPPFKKKYLNNIGFETAETFVALDDNDFEGWKLIKNKYDGKVYIPPKKIPRPHQNDAIYKCIEHFKNSDRGKIFMPCGTGKSLLSYWVARKLNAKSILVALPSLSLLQQTLKVWTREFFIDGIEPDWLCVCSDKSVSDDLDDFVDDMSEMGFKITTEKDEVRKWLAENNKDIKIIFTTYQSSTVTVEGSKDFSFDFAIFDEAHKTVGHEDKPKAHMISQKRIDIKKRLFMTATERLFRSGKEEYLSMDNENSYGKIIYNLSFKEAIYSDPPIISDYKVITFKVTDKGINKVNQSNKFIKIKEEVDDNITAREFATSIALRKSIKDLGIKNAISFHSSLPRAKNFTKQQGYISKIYKEYGDIESFHVSGSMPTNLRSRNMRSFAKSKKALLTNVRCLTEGVDLPSIDCVVFADPKRSRIDIVQAAGRALRLSPGKEFGYILIPIFISENEDPLAVAQGTAFDDVMTVVGHLSTHDTRISEYLRAVTEGRIPQRGSPIDGLIRINVLTKINENEFNKAIHLKIWDKIGSANLKTYDEAKNYALSLKLNGNRAWQKLAKENKLPKDLPAKPNLAYKYSGWVDWGIFLGTGIKQRRIRSKDGKKLPVASYEAHQAFAKKNNIKTSRQWQKYFVENIATIPNDISNHPGRNFKNWQERGGWGGFLGTGIKQRRIRSKDGKKLPVASYEAHQEFAKKHNIKGTREWIKFFNENIENISNDISAKPPQYLKDWKERGGAGGFYSFWYKKIKD